MRLIDADRLTHDLTDWQMEQEAIAKALAAERFPDETVSNFNIQKRSK